MKFFPAEQSINIYQDGFNDDILNRWAVGEALSSLCERLSDPMVFMLNGPWGTGKSYFLKRWVGAHTIQNGGEATTIYFDAFAHDYLNDPLSSLISALTDRLEDKGVSDTANFKRAAFKLMKPAAKIALSLATFGASNALNDLGDVAAEAVSNEAGDLIDAHWKQEAHRQQAMADFSDALNKIMVQSADKGSDEPGSLIIVIDELDRCRPDYALEVLEIIKHFFALPKIHFVLGANADALGNAVKARYGAGIDSQNYLKKFVDVELQLPSFEQSGNETLPLVQKYLTATMIKMEFPQHVGDELLAHLKPMMLANKVSIREIGKILSLVSLASPEIFEKSNWYSGWVSVFVTLAVSKVLRPELHRKFLRSTITRAEILDYFSSNENTLTPKINNYESRNPHFNHFVFTQVLSWEYLSSDGIVDEDNKSRMNGIAKKFDQFGELYDARKLPAKINSMWLDIFSVY